MHPDGGDPRAEHLPAGYDDEDPYADDDDLEAYPGWWRAQIEEFREHGMRPYRPPRFSDGEIAPEVVMELADDLGVTIRLRELNPELGDDWGLWVDGDRVARLGRHRDGDGYSVYELSTREFRDLVHSAVE